MAAEPTRADLPPIPDEAIREAEVMIGLDTWTRSPGCRICERERYACPEHAAESLVAAAAPHIGAAYLRDFADRMEKALDTIGAGEDPAGAYRFVVACARSLADEAVGE